jgi:DNA-binding response OmpR family regulator
MTHILIVDDNRPLVLAICESLRLRGFAVSAAFGGVEALQQADKDTPDLVLLDIEMPGMDGFRFCRELRSNPRLRATLVIFMSVRASLTDKLAAYEAGADDYLVKPFAMVELRAHLQALLRRSAGGNGTNGELALPNQVHGDRVGAAAPPHSEHVLEVGGLRVHLDNALVESERGAARLTPAEFELLRYLMEHPDQILSSERLLREVWLYPTGAGDAAVVRWHVKNLRRKIEVEPGKPVRLRTISHHGYILFSDPTAT